MVFNRACHSVSVCLHHTDSKNNSRLSTTLIHSFTPADAAATAADFGSGMHCTTSAAAAVLFCREELSILIQASWLEWSQVGICFSLSN